jgi:hypothetical protein
MDLLFESYFEAIKAYSKNILRLLELSNNISKTPKTTEKFYLLLHYSEASKNFVRMARQLYDEVRRNNVCPPTLKMTTEMKTITQNARMIQQNYEKANQDRLKRIVGRHRPPHDPDAQQLDKQLTRIAKQIAKQQQPRHHVTGQQQQPKAQTTVVGQQQQQQRQGRQVVGQQQRQGRKVVGQQQQQRHGRQGRQVVGQQQTVKGVARITSTSKKPTPRYGDVGHSLMRALGITNKITPSTPPTPRSPPPVPMKEDGKLTQQTKGKLKDKFDQFVRKTPHAKYHPYKEKECEKGKKCIFYTVHDPQDCHFFHHPEQKKYVDELKALKALKETVRRTKKDK